MLTKRNHTVRGHGPPNNKGPTPPPTGWLGPNDLHSLEQGRDSPNQNQKQGLTALLHVEGDGLYSVSFRGERIVTRVRDPETTFARALLARAVTGKLTLLTARPAGPAPSSTSRKQQS
jgi:hypothetical protein